MGRTEDRACSFKSDNMVSSPAPSLSYQSRTQIWRQLFLLVDLESSFVYTVLFTVESFYFRPTSCFIFAVTVWQFFVQSVLRSSLPLEPVGHSRWCNLAAVFVQDWETQRIIYCGIIAAKQLLSVCLTHSRCLKKLRWLYYMWMHLFLTQTVSLLHFCLFLKLNCIVSWNVNLALLNSKISEPTWTLLRSCYIIFYWTLANRVAKKLISTLCLGKHVMQKLIQASEYLTFWGSQITYQ